MTSLMMRHRYSLLSLIVFYSLYLHNPVHSQITSKFRCRSRTCCDEHEFCSFWASTAECSTNTRWMRPNCAISCGFCGNNDNNRPPPPITPQPRPATQAPPRPQPQSSCRDTSQDCGFWSQTGECESNAIWMSPNCPVSCNTCSGGQPIRPTQQRPQPQPQRNTNACAKEDNRSRRQVSLQDVTNSNNNFGCAPTLQAADCNQNLCYHQKYRSFDGNCNNLQRPLFGAAYQPLKRVQPPIYDDGRQQPHSRNRPLAREASRFLLSSTEVVSTNFNGLMMQWGQFLSHDIARTTMMNSSPCGNCGSSAPACFNIPTVQQDLRFGPQRCLVLPRSTPVCGGNGVREQFNENTAFLDASQVYGSSAADAAALRNGFSPFLRTSNIGGRVYPPTDSNGNFLAGDNRANLFIGLTAFHTLFVREHNRIAGSLQRLNPSWNSDQIYAETRKIVGAMMQAITYNEYLPKLIGKEFTQRIGRYAGYNANVDATISNGFTTGAFRGGHGMVQDFYPRLNNRFQSVPQGGYRFQDGIFQPRRLTETGIDAVIRGLMAAPVKMPQRITKALTEQMFGNTDLAARNIQRGRDHGIPDYNSWRAFCGMRRARSFNELDGIPRGVQNSLQTLYRSPDDIDLYVGGTLESPVEGGMMGPTYSCMVGEQFARIRNGDRLWFENPNSFTPTQLSELRKASLARVLCDSGEGFGQTPVDAFMHATPQTVVNCNQIPSMNLAAWQV